ncbi:MAG: alpha-ketoacid dehydrogenase subunit beta, partial [Deltaproteobacteria bacterium]|nr:alpha-ketoacid dehydrogenase subunit beta [Deltaproteobacteria bacterium]
MPSGKVGSNGREITFAQAIKEALAEEMRSDPRVFIIGEDVAEAGTAFKVLSGLVTEFGPERVIDSPISEAGIAGMGVGAAMTGMRPVVDLMYVGFLGVCADQIINNAAKIHYMFGGKVKIPLTIMTGIGAGTNSAAQHSETLYSVFTHFPGLKCVVPSSPYTAKG